MNATRTSELFNAPDADICFRSSDDVDFRLHSRNLECTTCAFPAEHMTTVDSDEIVQLAEPSSILEILFQATYPRPFPVLKELNFDTMLALAEAAEKYQIFSMIHACKSEFREVLYPSCSFQDKNELALKRLQDKRLRLLQFAIKHDDEEFMNDIPPLLMNVPPAKVAEFTPEIIYKKWLDARERVAFLRR
ncbi:hypothetical protein BDP27DRAFT_354219 [Rhodocollybia butyracea]|uniref:BTB domain-containing protein n=1 Tax=Rhodocollybia butyracea TaxID=206335 RepID=A0A9P5UBH0_9AGAR|nr:hypothetical protein BDP27DRAFT_354219 [Rhodocollybia butyracea]